jgi:hypothetical protein
MIQPQSAPAAAPIRRGIDPSMRAEWVIGWGHGPRLIRRALDRLCGLGGPRVAYAPSTAAVRRAGFCHVGEPDTARGPALLMCDNLRPSINP